MKQFIILLIFLSSCGYPVVGPQGPSGPIGNTGPTGSTGASGSSCSVTSSASGATITCPDGSTSTINNVSAVQFCPQAGATNYPSNFPEYGLVVGNIIYAVYWGTTSTSGGQKTSFLAQIVPGTYVSTGNITCTFTVHSDG